MANWQDAAGSASFPGDRPGHLSDASDNTSSWQRERSLSWDIRTIIADGFDDISSLDTADAKLSSTWSQTLPTSRSREGFLRCSSELVSNKDGECCSGRNWHANADGGEDHNLQHHLQADLVQQQVSSDTCTLGGGRNTASTTMEEGELHAAMPASKARMIVLEGILDSESIYVGHLRDIVEGYLQRCKTYPKLFTPDDIDLIFGNIERIYALHKEFLVKLKPTVHMEMMQSAQLGRIFAESEATFSELYVDYCNNHPHSEHKMDELKKFSDQHALFFESCRLLDNLSTSLDAYLLSPLHRIGAYPVLLSELLRCTSEDHPDYRGIAAAIDVMKGVTRLINEQKRRLENVVSIAQWQKTVTNWKGDDIYQRSTEMIHSAPLHKISKGHSQERHFFLFDHQIVYCKKDAIGGKLAYKGRLHIDNCEIIDLPDGIEVKYAWKMSNRYKDKWYVLYAKSAAQKKEWMEAFQKERKRVKEDSEKGNYISLKTKKAAIALHKDSFMHRRKSTVIIKTNVPSAPIGLKADRIHTTSVLLSWVAPHRLNGIIRGYQVSFTPQGENECLLDVEETTSAELTVLKPHTEYSICVRAKTVDYGDYCIPITVRTLDDDVPTKLSSILDSYQSICFKELKIAKLIFYGTPRTGKTTLRKQLLRDVDRLQLAAFPERSTSIAEVCDRIFVERIVVTGEGINEWKWTVQGLDDIAKTLLQCLDSKLLHSCSSELNLADNIAQEHSSVGMHIKSKKRRSRSLSALNTSIVVTANTSQFSQGMSPGIKKRNVVVPPSTHQSHSSTHHGVSIDIKQLFQEAVKTGKWSEVASALHISDKAMLIQIIDGGGQPSFQEIFPLLVSSTSAVILLMFKLTDDLEQPTLVKYQPNDNASEHIWQDKYVVRDCILHALSSIASSQPDAGEMKRSPFHSKVVLVGTHRDQLMGTEDEKKAAIERCVKLISSWLRQSKAFKSFDLSSIADLVTDISNFDFNDIQKIKRKIETLILQQEPQNIPAPWLVFDFVLRKYATMHNIRKVEKRCYEEIAKLCGIKNEEIAVVLHFLHHVAGTLLHYPEISELNHCVITDFQLIFDSVSRIIIQYFEHSAHLSDRDLLHKKGQFEASVLKEFSHCLTVSELLALLQHRHIVSALGEGSFFMPSVLPRAETEPSSADSCSFLVIFECGCCPVGLFCAATTRLIVNHKWEVKKSEQFRNKISFHYLLSGIWYTVVFTAIAAHYEVELLDEDAPSQVKLEIYKAINEVFNHICKVLHCPPPTYGFYCPVQCTWNGATYLQYQHPAKCAFNCEAQQLKCCYTDNLSMLTDKHKTWFEKICSQEKKRNLSLKTLLAFRSKIRILNVVNELGVNYMKLGVFLLLDDNGAVTHALEIEHQKNAELINTAILHSWLQGKGLQPVTWATLINVIKDIKCCALAAEMEGALAEELYVSQ